MTTAPLQTSVVVLELHAFLRDIDPARYRSRNAGRLTARARALATRLERLSDAEQREVMVAEVRGRFADMSRLLHDSCRDGNHRWHERAARLQAGYDALATALRNHAIHVPSHRPDNLRRNVFHIACAVGCIAIAELIPAHIFPLAFGAAILAWSAELSRRYSPALNSRLMQVFGPFAHPHESNRVNSATWFVTAIVVLAASGEIAPAIVGVAVLGVGDPVAAIIGRRFGRVRLIHGRTLEGSLAFLVAAGITAFVLLAVLHPEIALSRSLFVASAAALVGAAVELVSLRVDDNLGVPVAAAAAAWAALHSAPSFFG